MITIKRIMIPTDFSGDSVPGLAYGISLAKDHRAQVLVLHVLPASSMKEQFADRYVAGGIVGPAETPFATPARSSLEDLFAAKNQLLRNFLEQRLAREILAGVEVGTRIRLGNVVDEIVAAANEEQCDVIVMTSHVSRLRRLFRGSISERVARKAPCPVLTIMPSARIRTEKNERVPISSVDKWAA